MKKNPKKKLVQFQLIGKEIKEFEAAFTKSGSRTYSEHVRKVYFESVRSGQ